MALRCSRNRKFYKRLGIFTLLVTLIACALLFYASYASRENGCVERRDCHFISLMKTAELRQKNCRPACTTKDCLSAANFILTNIDDSADPCEDFYGYSCGGWAKSHSPNTSASILSELGMRMDIEIKDVLERIKSPPETVAGKLRTFYDSCIDKNASQLASQASALKFLKKIGIPDWPNLSPDFTFTSIEETLAMMAAYDQFSFVYLALDRPPGNFNTDSYEPLVIPYEILNLSVSMKMPYIWKGETEKAQPLVTQMLTYFGLDEDSANETWCDFMEFDQGFHNISSVSADLSKMCRENKTLCDEAEYFLDCSKDVPDEIVSLCKMIEYFITFQRIGDRYTTASINVNQAYFVNRIFSYIANYTDRVVANYLAIRVILRNLSYMGHRYAHLYEKQMDINLLPWQTASPFTESRWRYCVTIISDHLAGPLALQYINKKLPKEATNEIREIFDLIKQGLANVTATADWISEDMREKLTKVIKSVSHNMENYIEVAVNKTEIEAAYKEYHPTKESFLLNLFEHRKEQNRREFLHISSRHIWSPFRPFGVNAFYRPDSHHIELLFGVLLPPIYWFGRSKSANLAALGPLIGHEIGHVVGHFFKELKLEDVDEQTRESYMARKGCLTDQYGDFEIEHIGQKINTSLTFQDDLADHLGVALAIQAHRQYVERIQEEYAMPGLDSTPEQIFFLSYAQMWCSVNSKENAMEQWKYDHHSPAQFRVTGVVQNMEEFAEAFKCPRGSPMNPEKKCSFLPQPSN